MRLGATWGGHNTYIVSANNTPIVETPILHLRGIFCYLRENKVSTNGTPVVETPIMLLGAMQYWL